MFAAKLAGIETDEDKMRVLRVTTQQQAQLLAMEEQGRQVVLAHALSYPHIPSTFTEYLRVLGTEGVVLESLSNKSSRSQSLCSEDFPPAASSPVVLKANDISVEKFSHNTKKAKRRNKKDNEGECCTIC
eukprot:TRINITY_DN1703_c12_g1_i1.p1 TRINITY_DN1703_c12_g1~~TRINITY_DN1703_c12_g1_i1.p1  ORF type:complete len:143 (-),score=18.32 TRINITY_DN1703_c12_g1_i1:38-427(-)